MASIPRASSIGLALFTISTLQTAHAVEWAFTPTAQASETYTDNLTLTNSSNKIGDFISEVAPGIVIQETGNRTKASLDYSLQSLYYKDQSQYNQVYQHLKTTGNAELIEKTLFLDADASIMQQPISLIGAIGANNSNPTGNIANISTWSLSPYLKHRFGSIANGDARFTHRSQSYSMGAPSNTGAYGIGALSNSTSDSSILALTGGSAFNNLLWGLNYDNSTIRYTGMPDATFSTYSANIGYLFTPKFKVTLTGGYQNYSYAYIGPQPQSKFWSTEISWAPTTHTKMSASVGRMFFGKTQSMMLSHITRLTSMQAEYNQAVTTSILQQSISPATVLDQLLKAQIPNDAARQQAVQSMLASMGTQSALLGQTIMTNQVYLQKRFAITMGINLPKSIILLTAFNTKTSSLEQGNSFLPGTLNYGSINQQGGTASWNWQISPKLSSTLNTTLTKYDFPGQSIQENSRLIHAGLNKVLAHGMSGSISYRYQAMNSGVGGFNYTENAIIASLNYRN